MKTALMSSNAPLSALILKIDDFGTNESTRGSNAMKIVEPLKSRGFLATGVAELYKFINGKFELYRKQAHATEAKREALETTLTSLLPPDPK